MFGVDTHTLVMPTTDGADMAAGADTADMEDTVAGVMATTATAGVTAGDMEDMVVLAIATMVAMAMATMEAMATATTAMAGVMAGVMAVMVDGATAGTEASTTTLEDRLINEDSLNEMAPTLSFKSPYLSPVLWVE